MKIDAVTPLPLSLSNFAVVKRGSVESELTYKPQLKVHFIRLFFFDFASGKVNSILAFFV
jgi:hypothetical protein